MEQFLLTADQVKKYLNISDFRNVSREKLIEFVSAIPHMDKDVAIKIIEQFPEFSNYAQVLVTHYESIVDSILKENKSSVQAVMDGYMQVLKDLGELAKSESIEQEYRRIFAEKMVDIADKMASFDADNKRFLAGLSKKVTCFAAGTIIVCAAVLGVNIRGKKIPKMH